MEYRPDKDHRLNLEECLIMGMAALFNILIVIFKILGQAGDIFILNIMIMTSILIAATVYKRFPHATIRFLRDWIVLVFLIVIYLENRRLIPLINPHDLDGMIIAIDRFLFLGHDPTVLLERITYPLLTEVLQLFYASFYFLPFTLCVILYAQEQKMEFHIIASTIIMGFLLSYIGYYLTPAIGPRFTLDHLQSFPLRGVLFFDFIRNMLAQAEGVMRDCCPSGHTLVSLLTVLLARRAAKRFSVIASIWACLIIFSAVYLRYHYVTDLVAGLFLGLVVYSIGPGIADVFINRGRQVGGSFGMIPSGKEERPSG